MLSLLSSCASFQKGLLFWSQVDDVRFHARSIISTRRTVDSLKYRRLKVFKIFSGLIYSGDIPGTCNNDGEANRSNEEFLCGLGRYLII